MFTTLHRGEGVTAEPAPLTAGVAAALLIELADAGLLGCAGLRMAADSGGVVKAAEAGLAASPALLLLLGATTALIVRSALITSAPVVLPSLALLLQL
jgi:hypothetical protein